MDKWNKGETETELVPLENIKSVPVTAFAGADDTDCQAEPQRKFMERISSPTKFVSIPGQNHYFPLA